VAAPKAGEPTDEERWALCPPMPANPEIPKQGGDVTNLNADKATAREEGKSVFSGNVVITRDGRRLDADEAIYDRKSDSIDVTGNVNFFSEDLSFSGEDGHFNLGEQSGRINGARFRLQSAHGYGTARQVDLFNGEQSKLTGATYTTCPPGDESWLLDASTIDLDRTTNTGEAWDVVLDLAGVPVLYLPYMNFPLQGRKSGLLPPTYGASGRNGTDASVPWYWNIAPNRDATITPRYLSERGGMLMTEFRYLNADSSGQLNADGLPNDELYEGEDKARGILRFKHAQRFDDRWTGDVLYQGVSDPGYLNDIDDTLANSSARYLERHAAGRYAGDNWDFLARVQNFQPLLLGVNDYERLPQLLATGADRVGLLRYDFRTEYVNFAHPSPDVPTGSRVDLYPGLSLPLGSSAWFVTPRVAARYTGYELTGPVAETTPTRSVPIASLDSGLFFERDLQMFDTPVVQTVEPRLYYLYVPYRDQSGLHDFDSGDMTFSFDQLFRENRFSGADRMGDANRATAALTSRFLRDDNGVEAVRASVGQIFYFEQPRVMLGSVEPETRHYSDLAAELAAHPIDTLELSAASRWNPDVADARESGARLRYSPDSSRLVDMAWRYRDEGAEVNRDLLVLWPLSPRWQFVGRWFYNMVEERTVESVVGLQYQTCCWSVRGVVRDKPFLNDQTNELESDRSVFFTFELKGLATVGSSLASVIDQGMVGL
jgi:LPS-assembly protein